MKKTDLNKKMAKQLGNQLKASAIPDRFGKQSSTASKTADKIDKTARPKLVAITCRLPADVAAQLREMALTHADGIHGLMTEAARLLLDKAPAAKKVAAPKPVAKKPAAEKVAVKKAPAKKSLTKKPSKA